MLKSEARNFLTLNKIFIFTFISNIIRKAWVLIINAPIVHQFWEVNAKKEFWWTILIQTSGRNSSLSESPSIISLSSSLKMVSREASSFSSPPVFLRTNESPLIFVQDQMINHQVIVLTINQIAWSNFFF